MIRVELLISWPILILICIGNLFDPQQCFKLRYFIPVSFSSFRIWTSSPSPEDSSGLGFGAPSSPFDWRSFRVDLGIDLGVGVIVEVESGAQWARDSGQQWKRRWANQESGERTVSPRILGPRPFSRFDPFFFQGTFKAPSFCRRSGTWQVLFRVGSPLQEDQESATQQFRARKSHYR